MRRVLFVLGATLLTFLFGAFENSHAQGKENDPFDVMEKAFDKRAEKTEKARDAQAAELEKEWDQMEKEQNDAWEKMAREVERRWGDQVLSTEKTWVDYDPDYSARSRVDFDKGKITIEALVPTGEKNPNKVGKDRIAQKFEQLYREKNDETSQSILAGQIRTSTGETLSDAILDQFVQHDIVPEVQVRTRSLKSADGEKQRKLSATIEMVPEHMRIRAERYRNDVLENANKHGLAPELILAIIHTESAFNPKARSRAGAYGLMQLIPRHAARDAWLYLNPGKDRVIKPVYLLDPRHNIELGAAYVSLLSNQYLKGIADPLSREYAAIAAYNWGPVTVRKSLLRNSQDNTMRPQQVYEQLGLVAPDETRDYLERVTIRKALYAGMFTKE
jgi:membrane-bound lytic murein transglycosylase C